MHSISVCEMCVSPLSFSFQTRTFTLTTNCINTLEKFRAYTNARKIDKVSLHSLDICILSTDSADIELLVCWWSRLNSMKKWGFSLFSHQISSSILFCEYKLRIFHWRNFLLSFFLCSWTDELVIGKKINFWWVFNTYSSI